MKYEKMTPGKMRQELAKRDKEIATIKKDERSKRSMKRTDVTDGDFTKKA